MNRLIYTSGEILYNTLTEEEWKVVLVDDEVNELIIRNPNYGLRVVNITNLEVDYKKYGE